MENDQSLVEKIVVLFAVLGSDVALVVTREHHSVQLALAILPFIASLVVACLSVSKYERRIRIAEAADVDGNGVSRAATRREIHYFAFSSALALATLLDMVRIFRGWTFGPSFTMFPAVLAGAFVQYIFIEYLIDWIAPA